MADKLVLVLEDSQIIETPAIQPCADGYWISNPEQPENTYLLPSDRKIQLIQRVPLGQRAILNTLVREENRIGLALLKLEQWSIEYEKTHTQAPPITIFRSGSLSLSIMPNRVSHDVDIATTQAFTHYIHEKARHEPVLGEFRNLEFNPVDTDIAFEFMRGWKTRCADIVGASGTKFHVIHPIDCIHQKLLRTSREDFEEKDKPDIHEIIKTVRPTEETIINVFKMGARRYTDIDEEAATIRRANTSWFLNTFYPSLHLDHDIIRAAKRQIKEDQLALIGQTPLRHTQWVDLIQPEKPWPPTKNPARKKAIQNAKKTILGDKKKHKTR